MKVLQRVPTVGGDDLLWGMARGFSASLATKGLQWGFVISFLMFSKLPVDHVVSADPHGGSL